MEIGGQLAHDRDLWQRKRALRLIYTALYRRIAAALTPGRTLEIGAGTGNFKEFAGVVIASDLQPAPWLDLVADAQHLPIADGALDNVVMVDMLHHLPRPARGLAEAARVLRPGGRIVLAEPAITPVSGPFYRWLHREPVRFGVDPFGEAPLWPAGDPYAANQAIPTIMFVREVKRLARAFPELEMRSRRWINLLAYPLSGGFQRWSLLPAAVAGPLIALDDRLASVLGRACGFRMLVVLEKRTP